MKKPLIRLAVLVIMGAAAVAAVLVFKGSQKAAKEQEFLAELIADLKSIETDEPGRAYIEGLARGAHDAAAVAAFNSSGFMSGSYDVNTYQRTAVDAMIARARADGSAHIADKLREFKESGARLDLSDSAR